MKNLSKNKNVFFLSIIIILILSFKPNNSLASGIDIRAQNLSAKNPKLANIFLKWDLSDQEAIELSKWDLLILDMENQINNPEKIQKIRKLNPNIIILAYISSQEIRNDVYLYDNIDLRKKMFSEIPEDWYLKFDNRKISFWPNTWMINSSDYALTYNNKKWNDYLPEFVASEIIPTGLWDGVFYDNLFDSVSWLNDGQIDLDQNNQVDTTYFADSAWQQGNIKILEKTRQLIGYNYIILANSSSNAKYHKYLNGRVFENFPNPFKSDGSWQASIDSYKSIYDINVYPKIYIFNLTENDFTDYEKMRFGLVSSLLFDNVYFSFDESVSNHGQTWTYDEYGLDFSYPLTIAEKNYKYGFWQRYFNNFLVLLNPYDHSLEIDWPKNYQKIYSWYGEQLDKLTLSPLESVILEPILKIYNQAFKNKNEYQVFNYNGKRVRSWYLIDDNRYLSGELLVENELGSINRINKRINQIDSNNNGFLEKVEGFSGRGRSLVKIFNQNDKLVGVFRAFPDQFNCGVEVAIGDVDGDGIAEIITMPFWGGPHVRIFDFYGNLKYEFFATDKSFRGFYDLTIANINGDSKDEIFISRHVD